MSEKLKDSYTVEVGRRLAEARRQVVPKMTQARAAEAVSKEAGEELSSQAIANYEQGTRLPSPLIVDALCRIYGTTTASYVLGLGDAPQSVREATLLKKYRAADERGRYAIDRIADVESPEVSDSKSNESAA